MKMERWTAARWSKTLINRISVWGFMLKTMKSPQLNEVKFGWEDDMTGSGFEILCQAKIPGLEPGKLFWFGTELSR